MQGTLSTAGLPELTTAHTQLNAYSSALQEELAARQAAVTALTAEVARQVWRGRKQGIVSTMHAVCVQ